MLFVIDHYADINARTTSGATPLMFATQNGHTETVQLLIKRGANIDTQTVLRSTPLMLATKNRHTEIVQLLKKHGAIE